MKENPQETFGSGCLADLWRIEETEKQLSITAAWLHNYLHSYEQILERPQPNRRELENLQMKILTEATTLHYLTREYQALSHRNKDTALITPNPVPKARQLLRAAQTVLMTPVKH